MTTLGILLHLSLTVGVLTKTSPEGCDVKDWYFRMSRNGVFEKKLTPDQDALRADLEKVLMKPRYHPSRRMDCELLDRYEKMLQKSIKQNSVISAGTELNSDHLPTEVEDETDLTDLDSGDGIGTENTGWDVEAEPDSKDDDIRSSFWEDVSATPNTYKYIMTTRKMCPNENIQFVLTFKHGATKDKNLDEDEQRIEGNEKIPSHNLISPETRDMKFEQKRLGEVFKKNIVSTEEVLKTPLISDQGIPNVNLERKKQNGDAYDKFVKRTETKVPPTETHTKNRDTNTNDTLSQRNADLPPTVSETETLNSNNIPIRGATLERNLPSVAQSEQVMLDKVRNLISEKEGEYNLKLKTMEITIMRLENQLLVERVHQQNDTSVLLRLENHLLKMQNELLVLNQKYAQMVNENEYLKQRQAQYDEIEQERARNTSKYLSLAYDKQNELASQHERKLLELNKHVENQNSIIKSLKSKSEQLDQQIAFLFGVIQNQSDIISNITNKTDMMNKYREEHKVEIDKLHSKIKQSFFSPNFQKRWEQLLSDKLSFAHRKIEQMFRTTPNRNKQMSSENAEQPPQSNWCTGLSNNRKILFELLQKCKSNVSVSRLRMEDYKPPLPNHETPREGKKCSESRLVKGKLNTNKPANVKANNRRTKLVDNFLSCTRVGLLVSVMTEPCRELNCWQKLSEVFFTLCHVTKIHPYCITRSKYRPYTADTHGNMKVTNKFVSMISETTINSPDSLLSVQMSTKQDSDNTHIPKSDKIGGHDKLSNGPPGPMFNNKPHISISDNTIQHNKVENEIEANEHHDWTIRDLDSGADKSPLKVTLRNSDKSKVKPEFESGAAKKEQENNIKVQNLNKEENTPSTVTSIRRGPSDSVVENRTSVTQPPNLPAAKQKHSTESSGKKCDGKEPSSIGCIKLQTESLIRQESDPKKSANSQDKTPKMQDSRPNMHKNTVQQSITQPVDRKQPLYDSTRLKEPKDCYDHLKKGKTRDGSFTVMLTGYKRVQVFCDIKNGGWTVLQRRTDGSTNFFKDWQKYKDGFGSKFGEHWLGNDAIHHLTNQDHYQLRIELSDWNKSVRYAQYDHFKIGSEKEGYPIYVEGYSGDAGDGLTKHNGMKFSTKDVDNDLVVKEFDGSCAKRFNGAWWYYRCYSSNLNGKYYRGGKVAEKAFDGVAWKPWTGPNYSLRTVLMKVRPHNAKSDVD